MKNYDPEKGTVYYNLPENVILNFFEGDLSKITDISLFGTVNSGGSNIKIQLAPKQVITFSISFKPKDNTKIFIEKNGTIFDDIKRNSDIKISSNQKYYLINTNESVMLHLTTFGSLLKVKFYGNFSLESARPFSESYPEDILKNRDSRMVKDENEINDLQFPNDNLPSIDKKMISIRYINYNFR